MNMDAVTIEDCLDMWDKLGKSVILEDGKVIGFVKGGESEQSS